MNRWTEADLKEVAKRNQGNSIDTVIGIDPGKKTGFAVYDKKLKKMAVVKTLDFWSAYEACKAYPHESTKVVVEVSDTKAQFNKGKSSHTWSVNIGMVYRESHLIAEGLRRLGYLVKEVHPRGKVDKDKFKRLTGYDGRTNEHSRDAGMMAFKG